MHRLSQPSTWAGIGVFFQAVKSFFPQWGVYCDALSGLGASLAVSLNEKPAP